MIGALLLFIEEGHFENKVNKFVYSFAGHTVREHKRFAGTHQTRVMVHHLKAGVHIRSEIGLIDH